MRYPVYCRQLEDGSGFGVFEGTKKENTLPQGLHGGREKWELCVGFGRTKEEAEADYQKRK